MKYRTGEPGFGLLVERDDYIAYLGRCADEWENLPVYGTECERRKSEARHKRQAERIRARATEIKSGS